MDALSRRDLFKVAGAGAAAIGMAGRSSRAMSAGLLEVSAAARSAPLPVEIEAQLLERLQVGENTDPLAAHTTVLAENLEPVIPHPQQAEAVAARLADLEARTGKKPNLLVFLMDNVGWGDPGIYGGGLMTGAPTPNIDRLGREGLQLLSTYSQPSCTPTRWLTRRRPCAWPNTSSCWRA